MNIQYADPHRDVIQRLTMHWRGAAREARTPATALRLEQLLQLVSWRPVGMKPNEIMLIRHLRLPAVLSAGGQILVQWETLLQTFLSDLYHIAQRPYNGAQLSEANSLIFEDMAHLLICLTHEVLAGGSNAVVSVMQQWYWQQFVGAASPSTNGALLSMVWSRHAEYVPTMLAGLRREEALRAVAELSSTEVQIVLRALEAAYSIALPHVLFSDHSMLRTSELDSSRPAISTESLNSDSPVARTAEADNSRPAAVTHLPASMRERHARLLLKLCTELHKAPAYARSDRFLKLLGDWWADGEQSDASVSAAPSEPSITQRHPLASAADKEQNGRASTASPESLTFAHDAEAHDRDVRASATPDAITQARSEEVMVDQASEFMLDERSHVEQDGIATQLAGTFFLINMLTWLGLPSALDAWISGWAIIEAIARFLLNDTDERYMTDPLWTVLRDLDGRMLDAPLDFGQAEHIDAGDFRLPTTWLQRFASPAQWMVFASEDGDRLLVLDLVRGFVVVDVDAHDQPLQALAEAEITAYQQAGCAIEWSWADTPFSIIPSVADHHTPTLSALTSWWLERASGFIRYLLASATDSDLTLSDLATMILCKAGTLSISRTHIDITMLQESVDVRLRRAGLDRDPGWSPDLGYIIHYHFDQ